MIKFGKKSFVFWYGVAQYSLSYFFNMVLGRFWWLSSVFCFAQERYFFLGVNSNIDVFIVGNIIINEWSSIYFFEIGLKSLLVQGLDHAEIWHEILWQCILPWFFVILLAISMVKGSGAWWVEAVSCHETCMSREVPLRLRTTLSSLDGDGLGLGLNYAVLRGPCVEHLRK